MILTPALVIKILLIILLIAAIFLLVELGRTIFKIRKLVNRLDMLTDVREWLNVFRLFSKKKSK